MCTILIPYKKVDTLKLAIFKGYKSIYVHETVQSLQLHKNAFIQLCISPIFKTNYFIWELKRSKIKDFQVYSKLERHTVLFCAT